MSSTGRLRISPPRPGFGSVNKRTTVPSRILPRYLQFCKRTGEWVWHGFESGFGLVFIEVGTEGTGSKIDLKKLMDPKIPHRIQRRISRPIVPSRIFPRFLHFGRRTEGVSLARLQK